ncbi:globin family protein [Algiphilus sp.]|uniref:globin family protein n=1 Tax=Algiphilus sp. TaxID=1872431 RepID=UPI003B521C09
MSPEQIQRVQHSFALVAPIADQAAALFYDRLFTQHPEVRPLFSGDIKRQGAMLMQTLALAVKHLHEPQEIMEPLRALGRRHVGYGVKEAHYPLVGDALLWTLEQGLGEAFDAETREAWAAAYGLLAGVMCEAAADAQAA